MPFYPASGRTQQAVYRGGHGTGGFSPGLAAWTGTSTSQLRTADFETRTRSLTVPATHSEFEVLPILDELYARARTDDRPIRLLGVAFSNLVDQERQYDLFDDRRPLLDSVDAIRGKYGFDAVGRGTTSLRKAGRSPSVPNRKLVT